MATIFDEDDFVGFFNDFFGFLAIFLVLGILGFRVYRIFLGFKIFFWVSGFLREGHFDAQKLVFAKIQNFDFVKKNL